MVLKDGGLILLILLIIVSQREIVFEYFVSYCDIVVLVLFAEADHVAVRYQVIVASVVDFW